MTPLVPKPENLKLREPGKETTSTGWLASWPNWARAFTLKGSSPINILFFLSNYSDVNKRGRPSKWPPECLPSKFLQILSVRFPYNSLEKI